VNQKDAVDLANRIVENVAKKWYYAGSPMVHRPDIIISLRAIVLETLLKEK